MAGFLNRERPRVVNASERSRGALVLVLAWSLCVPVLAGAADTEGVSEARAEKLDRRRDTLMLGGDEADRALERSGSLFGDEALDGYMQEVLDRLFPEHAKDMRIRAIRDNSLNAFARFNGSLYMNTGMLLRMQNEAQLAAILGHEGIHWVEEHGLEKYGRRDAAGVFVNLTFAAGAGGIGSGIGESSVSGFSRDKERESDRLGYQRMKDAGYDVSQAAIPFRIMAAELGALDMRRPNYFFSSHPRMEERIESFEELISAEDTGGEIGRERFLQMTEAARMDALSTLHGERAQRILIYMYENTDVADGLPPEAAYYFGEGYRMRGDEDHGDLQKALDLYQQCIETAPGFAPAYYALGIQDMKSGEAANARARLQHYLDLAPDGKFARYATLYLKRLEGS